MPPKETMTTSWRGEGEVCVDAGARAARSYTAAHSGELPSRPGGDPGPTPAPVPPKARRRLGHGRNLFDSARTASTQGLARGWHSTNFVRQGCQCLAGGGAAAFKRAVIRVE